MAWLSKSDCRCGLAKVLQKTACTGSYMQALLLLPQKMVLSSGGVDGGNIQVLCDCRRIKNKVFQKGTKKS